MKTAQSLIEGAGFLLPSPNETNYAKATTQPEIIAEAESAADSANEADSVAYLGF